MEQKNDFIKLQANSKQLRIEVDLANLLRDPCLKKKKKCDYFLKIF